MFKLLASPPLHQTLTALSLVLVTPAALTSSLTLKDQWFPLNSVERRIIIYKHSIYFLNFVAIFKFTMLKLNVISVGRPLLNPVCISVYLVFVVNTNIFIDILFDPMQS